MQRTRNFNHFNNNCGLSCSVYQTCYPDSLTDSAKRASSVSSIQTMESDSLHPTEKAATAATNMSRANAAAAAASSGGKPPVTFYIADDHDDELSTPATATGERHHGDHHESDDYGSSIYEEECHFGLQKLLSHNLTEQVSSLFGCNFGSETSVLGLSEVLPSVIDELLHMCEDEPYGVRGANLTLVLERPRPRRRGTTSVSTSSSSASSSRKSSVMSNSSGGSSAGKAAALDTDVNANNQANCPLVLGSIKMCYETVTTFELILTLREGRNLAVSIRNWMANVFRSRQILVIEPNFHLLKRKLYRFRS